MNPDWFLMLKSVSPLTHPSCLTSPTRWLQIVVIGNYQTTLPTFQTCPGIGANTDQTWNTKEHMRLVNTKYRRGKCVGAWSTAAMLTHVWLSHMDSLMCFFTRLFDRRIFSSKDCFSGQSPGIGHDASR